MGGSAEDKNVGCNRSASQLNMLLLAKAVDLRSETQDCMYVEKHAKTLGSTTELV